MTEIRWKRRDGKGYLSVSRQKEYERAGITYAQYERGYRLVSAIVPPRGVNNVNQWSRDSLETTVQIQWKVIRQLERKLDHGKQDTRDTAGSGRG